MQRSGSGWFETLLNSHPNVSSNGEIFSVRERRENISSIFETLDRLYDMDWITSAAKNECTAAFGLKWMLNQVIKLHHSFTRVCVNVYYHVAFDNIFMFLCSKPKKKSDFFGNLKGLVIMLSTQKKS